MRGFYGGFIHPESDAFQSEFEGKNSGQEGSTYFSCSDRTAQSPDQRFSVTFYGRIENAIFLRNKLAQQGFTYLPGKEADMLAAAWQLWNSNFLSELKGAFAFIVYDKKDNILFLIRDALGKQPLYVYQDKKNFLFTTEIKYLLSERSLDLSLQTAPLYNYLIFLYQPGEQTLFQNIRFFPPGHFGVYDPKSHHLEKHRFYQLPYNGKYDTQLSEKEWTNLLEEQLQQVVAAQLKETEGLCVSLSGGLDSSLLTAIAAKQTGEKFPCFTIGNTAGMIAEGFGNDLKHAKHVAHSLKLDLNVVSGELNLDKELDRMVWLLEAPHGDPAAIHQLHISEAASASGMKVMLGGAGGDDVFAGYRRHQALRWLFLKKLPAPVKEVMMKLAALKGKPAVRRMQKMLFGSGDTQAEQMFAHFFWLEPKQAIQLLYPQSLSASTLPDPFGFMRRTLAEIPKEQDKLNQMLAMELRIFTGSHNLLYLNKLSLAAGIEPKAPYLDEGLIALSARMSPSIKLKGNTTKYILKKVAERYLPKEIVYRKKTGFAAPVRSLLTGPLSGFVKERLLEGSLRQQGIFNEKEIEQLILNNASGSTDAAYPIFTLLAIESWLRQFKPA